MVKLAVLVAVCVVSGMTTSMTPVLDKPHYDLQNAQTLFNDFMKEHGKSYSGIGHFQRFQIFKENLEAINRLNAEYPETVFALNHLADMTYQEFMRFNGFKLSSKERGVKAVLDSSVVLPTSYDWRDHGAVTPVKPKQGLCGSCFIFSAIGNIEGQHAIKHQQCLSLSESQALDCLLCTNCGGGIMHEVMQEFANRSTGAMLAKDYHYRDDVYPCHEDAGKAVVHVKDGQIIDIANEDILAQKLVELGPLAVALTSDFSFMFYKSGIKYPTDTCTQKDVNHGVVLVGYGEDKNGTKYWTLKNSAGPQWGEDGYFRLLRGVNACHMGTGYTASATVY